MKIGIIGHEQTIEYVQPYLDNYDTLVTETIIFNNESQKHNIVSYLKTEEEKFDGLLFTGRVPYMIINGLMVSKKPWVYLEYDTSSLLRTLFHASVHLGHSLKNVSIDSFSKSTVKNAYESLSLSFSSSKIKTADFDIQSENLLNYLTEFHKDNFWNNSAKFCITGIAEVYKNLLALDIPVLRVYVSNENITKAVQMLQLKTELEKTEMRQIVVVDIIIDPSSVITEDEYHTLLENNKVSEEIYKFAQETQSAITEDGKEHYMLFCTKNTIETATNNFNSIPLVEKVMKNTNKTLSLGIGYGITVREAKLAAEKGSNKAFLNGGNRSYIVRDNNIIGPLNASNSEKKSPNTSNYQKIARKSGISISNIFKIHNAVLILGKSTYSSREIANLSGISFRNMTRLIRKLEEAGFVESYGKEIVGDSGRPSRIFKINFSS